MSISFGQQNTAFILWPSDVSMPFLCSAHIYLQPLYLVRDCTPYIGRLNTASCPSKHIASPFSHFGHSLSIILTLLSVFTSIRSALYVSVLVLLGLTILICVCNIAIWRNFQHQSVDSQHRNGASRNRRLTKTLLLVSILALLCWLPLIILNVLIYVTEASIPWKFYHMANILNYSNSFVNPIVYVFRIREFQQALRLCCTKSRPAIKMVKFKGRNLTAALRTPEIELRIFRNDPTRLQIDVER